MFKCSNCKQVQTAGTQPVRVPTETRRKVYPERSGTKDRGGVGWEIVREITVCGTCSHVVKAAGPPEPVIVPAATITSVAVESSVGGPVS